MARPERRDQAHDSADEEEPAQEDCDGDGGERRDYDRQQAQHHEDYPLDQEKNPMPVKRLRPRALQPMGGARGPWPVRPPSPAVRLPRTIQPQPPPSIEPPG